jgi:hypothetical protein
VLRCFPRRGFRLDSDCLRCAARCQAVVELFKAASRTAGLSRSAGSSPSRSTLPMPAGQSPRLTSETRAIGANATSAGSCLVEAAAARPAWRPRCPRRGVRELGAAASSFSVFRRHAVLFPRTSLRGGLWATGRGWVRGFARVYFRRRAAAAEPEPSASDLRPDRMICERPV